MLMRQRLGNSCLPSILTAWPVIMLSVPRGQPIGNPRYIQRLQQSCDDLLLLGEPVRHLRSRGARERAAAPRISNNTTRLLPSNAICGSPASPLLYRPPLGGCRPSTRSRPSRRETRLSRGHRERSAYRTNTFRATSRPKGRHACSTMIIRGPSKGATSVTLTGAPGSSPREAR